MKLEQQVCSPSLAKKLKALGVQQDSYLYWGQYSTTEWRIVNPLWRATDKNSNDVSAFTVAELGEMLPSMTISYHKAIGEWTCKTMNEKVPEITMEMTEADARAQMLIYLIKHKIIK